MNISRYLTESYAKLLTLYPADFQAEFGEEILSVFGKALKEASCNGLSALIAVCLRELADLPKNLLREYVNKVRKDAAMKIQPPVFDSRNTAMLGALGFGLGYALLIVLRTIIDPYNHTILHNFGVTWVRETLLFMLIGALGGAFIGTGNQATRQIGRFALAGTLGSGMGGCLGTLLLFLYYHFGVNGDFDRAPLLNLAVTWIGVMLIGSLTGCALGIAQNSKKQAFRLACAGAIGFGVSFIISELIFIPARAALFQTEFFQYWAILLTFSTLIAGAIGGAILGWAMDWKRMTTTSVKAEYGDTV